MQQKPVLISYPCHDMLHSDFAHCLTLMSLYCGMRAGIEVGISQTRTSIICSSRNMMVQQALTADTKFSHILMLDSDMTFPYDTLERLLSHRLPVVGASYSMRMSPRAMVHRDGSFSSELPALGTHPNDVYPVLSLGMGCVLIDLEVFRALDYVEPDTPFFKVTYRGKKLDAGEDVFFYRRLNAAGVTVHCDIALSYKVRHVGQYQYGTADVEKVIPAGTADMDEAFQLPGLGDPCVQ